MNCRCSSSRSPSAHHRRDGPAIIVWRVVLSPFDQRPLFKADFKYQPSFDATGGGITPPQEVGVELNLEDALRRIHREFCSEK